MACSQICLKYRSGLCHSLPGLGHLSWKLHVCRGRLLLRKHRTAGGGFPLGFHGCGHPEGNPSNSSPQQQWSLMQERVAISQRIGNEFLKIHPYCTEFNIDKGIPTSQIDQARTINGWIEMLDPQVFQGAVKIWLNERLQRKKLGFPGETVSIWWRR